jgi:predicted P-loop ATPase
MSAPQFKYGANFEFRDKAGAEKLSHARAWRQTEGGFTDLAKHISRGLPWMPALLDKGSRREKSAANYAEIIAADIDDGWPIQQAKDHPFVAAHCGLGIESASSTPEMPKFRLVFRLAAPVEEFKLIELVNRYLIHLLQSDAACKDASRFFFGAQGRSPFLLNESAVLPDDFLDQAAMWQSEQEAALERDRQARAKLAAQWAAESPDSDQQRLKDVEEALSCIAPYKPGEGRYSDLLRAIAGVLNELGDAGRSLLLSWDGGRGEWGKSFDRKLDSIAKGSGKATLGSLFYLAKSEGWKPQRATQSSSKPARKSAAKSESEEAGDRPSQAPGDPEQLCRLAREYQALKRLVGDRLRLNELTHRLEFDGCETTLDDLELDVALEFNREFRRFQTLSARIAKENGYHPIRAYLEGLVEQHGNSTEVLSSLAERYLGQSAGIYQTFLRKTLIAAVARVFEPGCKVDTALILQGDQGINKSGFFKVLASPPWFDDTFGKASDKDERLKLHQAWITEWAELSTIFRRKDVEEVKAFLTCSTDRIRPPYGRETEVFKRSGIIVGTTNDHQFLPDPTGNRRFWVVPVRGQIDLAALEQERDRIWAAAVAAYQAGEQWWLTGEEEMQAEAIAEEFATSDPWQDAISDYLEFTSRTSITVSEILCNCLKVELARQTRSEEMRVTNTLRRLGWQKSTAKTQRDGKRRREWIRPEQPEVAEEATGRTPEPAQQNGDAQQTLNQWQSSDDWEPTPASQPFEVGDRVTCERGQGTITRIDGAEAFIEGESFLDWVKLSKLRPSSPSPALNGRGSP